VINKEKTTLLQASNTLLNKFLLSFKKLIAGLSLTDNQSVNGVNGSITSQEARRNRLKLSFYICCVYPFILITLYYAFIASDRYASSAGFSVRGVKTTSSLDGLGALTGLAASGSTTSDSYIILQYLKSRALFEDLDKQLKLREEYSKPSIDYISRLSKDAYIEEVVEYWSGKVKTEFDSTSGIIDVQVQTFSPEYSLEVLELVIKKIQDLVNGLSASARQDALKFAETEVNLQEARLRKSLQDILEFRTNEQSVDPAASAALDIELLSTLEGRMIDINAQIAVQRTTLNANAPSLLRLKRQSQALKAQIEKRRSTISGNKKGNNTAISIQLTKYETLEVERRFAEQAYASSLNSLEQARRDADRQQRYLAVHLYPLSAEKSEYPRRIRNIFLAAFLLIAFWGIGALLVYSIRDHLT